MISIEKKLLTDRRSHPLTGLDGSDFVQLEKYFTPVMGDELASQSCVGRLTPPPETEPPSSSISPSLLLILSDA